ncbi:MAG: glycosyl transferase family 1 [Pseudanabaena frigida]|uniref:Glycosyl transferase family 1 n=1 Tax=Pseudanabaena frigida TaxID=945775 RepID=A0A2W4W5K1_9CYAN|nr:MAG: glycosyl transferase family 1 [Pseudanabaena frigida]
MLKILILIGGHLCSAPRAQKEARVLANAGYDVIIGGFWFEPVFIERDRLLLTNQKFRFNAIVDFQPNRRFTNYWIRLQTRIAKEIFRRFGVFLPELLSYGTRAMLKYAQEVSADITIVHSEGGMWVGKQLLDRGFNVGVDFEDWFSEDLLPNARIDRPIDILKSLENQLINECKYCLTTSHSLAEALAKAYQVPKPTAIYNSFPWSERSQIDAQIRDRQNLDLASIHWFSQTIGQGRGLEVLFQSLPYINKSVEIHLRGNYPEVSRQWLESQVPPECRDRLFIHPTVPNDELLSRIAEHDIGLALECNSISSRNLTITNKFFQYLQAGLAIVATNTEGQYEILSQYPEIGELIPSNDFMALAEAINSLIDNMQKLKHRQKAALEAAQEKLNWENQEDTILKLIEKAISK